jgi:hypothetical protein
MLIWLHCGMGTLFDRSYIYLEEFPAQENI